MENSKGIENLKSSLKFGENLQVSPLKLIFRAEKLDTVGFDFYWKTYFLNHKSRLYIDPVSN